MKEQINYEVTDDSAESCNRLSETPIKEQKKDNWLKALLSKLIDSYQSSNHFQHMVTGLIIAIFGTIFCTLFFAEAKERHDASSGGIYDKSDIVWTMVGGVLGQIIQAVIIVLIIKTL